MSNPTASVMCHAENIAVPSECCEAPCLSPCSDNLVTCSTEAAIHLPTPNLNISQWGVYHLAVAKLLPAVGLVKYVSNMP